MKHLICLLVGHKAFKGALFWYKGYQLRLCERCGKVFQANEIERRP